MKRAIGITVLIALMAFTFVGLQIVQQADAQPFQPKGYVTLLAPQNNTLYHTNIITVTFTQPWTKVTCIYYLDGVATIFTPTFDGTVYQTTTM
jgi:hypothetical protein